MKPVQGRRSPCAHTYFSSPLGWILLASTEKGICLLRFLGQKKPSPGEMKRSFRQEYEGGETWARKVSPHLERAKSALLEYLERGEPWHSVPLDFSRGTPFQVSVWNALCKIPHGETRTYGQVALAVGKPGAARAVGRACGGNPIAVLVPCHRVVALGGKPGGYSGGIPVKKALLQLEKDRNLQNIRLTMPAPGAPGLKSGNHRERRGRPLGP